MNFSIECEEEVDGRWIAEIPQLPGALCYGATAEEAIAKVEVLALRAIGPRMLARIAKHTGITPKDL